MATATMTRSASPTPVDGAYDATLPAQQSLTQTTEKEKDKVLPLPGWLVKVYFIFPVILYMPDIYFNFFVYSDGFNANNANPLLLVGTYTLCAFLSVGLVGMAYLLSVLAPWHWGQGHRIQAFFCGVGVIIATAITTWNSLAYRSQFFTKFNTDDWANGIWPQLKANNISITMILVAIAPPFWGLFWALVQPTETGRSLRQLQESHAEKMLRLEQEAEEKRLKAEMNAKIREAQIKGLAATAAATRSQAQALMNSQRAKNANDASDAKPGDASDGAPGDSAETLRELAGESGAPATALSAPAATGSVMNLPTFAPASERDGAIFMNHAAASAPTAHAAPAYASGIGQPALLGEPTAPMANGASAATRRPAILTAVTPALGEEETLGMTGTTGPHPAVHRSEQNPLLRAMNEPNREYMKIVAEAARELEETHSRQPTQREVTTLVAQRLNVGESVARSIVGQYRQRRNGQSGRR